MKSPLEKIARIREAFPAQGLFAEKEWLLSPEAFSVEAALAEDLEKLGHRLNLFNRACNQLYQLSAQGRQPRWVAEYLDRGKPPELVEFARQKGLRNEVPRVIRPDIILTETGFTVAEIDSVPGGIGLTAWLNRTYADLGAPVIGGRDGMLEGFRAILPGGGDIVISEEAATYRPEMEWLAAEAGFRVLDTSPRSDYRKNVYRFFELFDLPNIACAPSLMDAVARGALSVTPPFKPYIEEKMWFALFWMRPLQEFWRRELGERHWLKLREVIPYSWVVDPAPLPQHAVIPRLEINRWEELGDFSQKHRELLLKISGFSELAWGSRGLLFGQDMPHGEWKAAVARAVAEFERHPYILQQFHKGKLVRQPFLDGDAIKVLHGRVRLCPYYFVIEDKARLKGALATVCPADKKFLHGMKNAILVPTQIAE